jgi:hypothetical protein
VLVVLGVEADRAATRTTSVLAVGDLVGAGMTARMPRKSSSARWPREECALSPRTEMGVVRGSAGQVAVDAQLGQKLRKDRRITRLTGADDAAKQPAPCRRPARASCWSVRRGTARWRDRPVRPGDGADSCHSTAPPCARRRPRARPPCRRPMLMHPAIVESTDTRQSISPAVSASACNAASTRTHVPSCDHFKCRRCTDCHAPYSRGHSRHGHPALSR